MSDFDFANNENPKKLLKNAEKEALRKLNSRLKDSDTTYARKVLSEALGIDLDKLVAFINKELSEQTEPESASDVLAEDLFTAQDPNRLQSTYRAIELPLGTVITIEGVEFLHTLIDHGDHGHSAWVNTMTELLDDDTVAELARSANGNVMIIHFG